MTTAEYPTEPYQPTRSTVPPSLYSDAVLITTIALGARRPLSIYKQTGISVRAVQLALDRLEAEGRVVNRCGDYYATTENIKNGDAMCIILTAIARVSKKACIRILEKIGPRCYVKKDAELIDLCTAFLATPSPENALAVLGNVCSDAQYLDCLEPPFAQWADSLVAC